MSVGWLAAAYACSGMAGLVYEVAWTRLLTLHLGHTTAAAATVTAAFMGGLGAGAVAGGRLAAGLDRRQTLAAYALLELAVAAAALAMAPALGALAPLFAWAYGETGAGVLFPAVRVAVCLVAVAVPAMALGATFPLVVHVADAGSARPGGWAGRLYAVNTAGAALGALAAGFVLLPAFGIFGTTLVGAAAGTASILAALTLRGRLPASDATTATASRTAPAEPAIPAAAARRRGRPKRTPHGGEPHRTSPKYGPDVARVGLAASVLALTGAATFFLEIAWSRVLALVLGPSTYAFAATVAAFVSGLALGSFAGASLAARSTKPARALGLVLLATAAVASVAEALVGGPLLDAASTAALRSPAGSLVRTHLTLALGLTLPIATGLGLAFPLALRVATGPSGTLAPARLGFLYAINTAAAVGAAMTAGFVTIPVLGLRATLTTGAATLLAGAVLLVLRAAASRDRAVLVAAATAVAALMAAAPRWDRERLAAGGYLYTRFVPPGVDARAALTAGSLLYYREGATGTVTVRSLTGERSLAIDGKVDASTGRDMLTQKALAHVPLLLHPDPRAVAIVGLGSGVTLASALAHPVASVDVVEISPEVVEASAFFAAEHGNALDDPRTRLVVGDGRSHLSLTSRRYDVVVSEPSNPWMAGVAALFTQEFFAAVRARLAPGGVFCQWAHTYDVAADDLRSIVATFQAAFPHATMWLVGDGDLLLVGSEAPLEPRLSTVARTLLRPRAARDLAAVGVRTPLALFSLYAGGPDELTRYAAGAPIQTDDRMALEFSGPLAALGGTGANQAPEIRALLGSGPRPHPLASLLDGASAADWRSRADMFLAARAFEAAYHDYAEAIDRAPTDAAALDGFVRAAGAARRTTDAEARLRALGATHAGVAAPRVALANLLGSTGRLDEAVTVARAAAAAAPRDAASWEQLAALHADRGDPGALAAVADVLVRDFPDRAAGSYFGASARFLRGDATAALPLVRRAIALDPRHADAHNLLGAILGTMGDVAAAREAFGESLRLDPRDAVTYTNLAQLELAAGRPDVAADRFAEAVTLDPASVPAREGLAQAAALR